MKAKKVKNEKRAQESKALALHFMKTLVEVARESFVILDANLRVLSANPTFYKGFKVSSKQTENMFLYKLGDGQWDIPELRSLLEEILPKKKTVKNYEVTHEFEKIGEKTILLNARQIDSVQLIVLAMEDITHRKKLEQRLAEYAHGLEEKIAGRTRELALRVRDLESMNRTMVGRELKMVELKKEIEELKRRLKNGSQGKNGSAQKHGKER